MSQRLFWDTFTRSIWVKAVALALMAALVVVQCGREGGKARSLANLNYDSLPADAPRPKPLTKPAEKLHAAVTQLKDLLAVQAKRDLSDEQAEKAGSARGWIATELRALDRQFDADRAKLEDLDGDAALARLDNIESQTTRLARALESALAQVPENGDRAAGPAADATERLTALSPDAPQQPLSTGFGTKNAKDSPASLSAGITPAYSSPISTEAASSLPRDAEQADLAETAETRVTPAIQALAERLNRDPVEIYGYVRNEIRYEPYHGIRKGAHETLAQKSGSAADQAALLVALLRNSGVHARFVQGVAELPAAKAANWLGVDSAAGERSEATADILASGGVPTTQVRVNGEFVKLRFDHVWAEAYVPSDAYRGAEEQLGERTWLPLDPSIKENELIRPVADFSSLVEPKIKDWAEEFVEGSETANDHEIIGPPAAETNSKMQALLNDVQAVLTQHGVDDDSTVEEVIGGARIKRVAQTYLPATTPFRERGVLGEMRSLPASLNASVSVTVSGADPLSLPSTDPNDAAAAGFTYVAPTRELANKRITLAYVPATETDAEIIDAYHGLLNAPTYAASLIPVLRVDGEVVARGQQAVSTGYTQNLKITYRMPGFASEVVENPLYVGSLSALALSVGPASLEQMKVRAQALDASLSDTDAENLLTDARMGEVMSLLGSYYFARNDQFDELAAQGSGIDRNRLVSGAILASATGVSYIAGFPVFARFSGYYIDVDEDAQSVVSKVGDDTHSSSYLRAAGMHASSSEGLIFSRPFGRSAVSTAAVMRDATERGAAILKIDTSTLGRLDELGHLSKGVRQEIVRAVSERNATVFIPQSETTIGGWTGVGYIIDEGSTLSYRISGGANGGFMAVASFPDALGMIEDFARELGKWFFEEIICGFLAPPTHGAKITSYLLLLSVPIASVIVQGGALVAALSPWGILAWAVVVTLVFLWSDLYLADHCPERNFPPP